MALLNEQRLRTSYITYVQKWELKNNPNEKTIAEVFAELDEDGSDDISVEELKGFLRKLFVCQKDEVAKALGKK